MFPNTHIYIYIIILLDMTNLYLNIVILVISCGKMTNAQAGIQAGIQAVENTGNEEWHDFQGTETKNFVSGNVHYNA